ncbi:Sterol O-acyltransferase 2 (Sterol-ester synthase 2) [Friedmanniomyces endolithicus]|nr:Sterol O-acyltransferase 2 (Sterol-ester synthase 2) [Friedmanniomyces endolithicus]
MADSAPPRRPPLDSKDTLDAPHLLGSIGRDGLAALQADMSAGSNGHVRPAKSQTEARDFSNPQATASGNESAVEDESDETIEDYDELQLDPDTLIANSRKSMSEPYRPSLGVSMETNGQDRFKPGRPKKRNSIQIRLEKTDRKGRYVLTADDPEIREVLRRGIEREEQEMSGKQPRTRFRDMVFTRQFTTFDRQNNSSESQFFGFFTLFWMSMAFVILQSAMKNLREYGSILGTNEIAKMMFSRDVLILGITDGVMTAGMFVTYLLQVLVQKGYINWSKGGWVVQNVWQSVYLASVVGWAYFREWPWTHTIFAVLHGLVFLMKQHSYAFYNGYLSSVYRRKTLLEAKLEQLQAIDPMQSPPTSPRASQQIDLASGIDLAELSKRATNGTYKRRPSMGPRTSTNLAAEKSDVASVAAAIQSGNAIDTDQMETFERIIRAEIDDLTKELQGKSPAGRNAYPKSLRLFNFAEFICLPTLVYELEYPRQDRINWWYVAEKLTATFGVLCIMQVISQAYIYPPVAKTVAMKEAGMPIEERWREFPFIVSDMLFPLLIEQLLTWYLIWECILNVLAEITFFADRGFYGDWWNSVTWDQYARDWNRPVHTFLLRHVYHSSISTFHISRHAATFITFLLSALVHEMCMAIMFKKVRGYLFSMQLMQMPLVMFSRSKLLKGRVVLGNVVFWLGLFIGPSFLTSLDRDALDRLLQRKKVGFYAGIDPTAPSLHLGHLLPLMVLFWLYNHGHSVVSLVGGATARVGDPSGRLTSRTTTAESVHDANFTAMHAQLGQLWSNAQSYGRKHGHEEASLGKRQLLNNATWLDQLNVLDFLRTMGNGMRLGAMLGRDTVRNKMEKGDGMSFAEFTYPLLQAWDWWHMYREHGVQVQIGGSDQYGNIVAGMDAVKHIAQTSTDSQHEGRLDDVGRVKEELAPMGLTVPLLTTASGEKFGKSAGNAVWLDSDMTSAFDLYGFLLRSSDEDVERYLKLFTFIPTSGITAVMAEHKADPGKRKAQHLLAGEVLELVHGKEVANETRAEHQALRAPNLAALTQQEEPTKQTGEGRMGTERVTLPSSLVMNEPFSRILYHAGFVKSKSEGARLIAKGGAYVASPLPIEIPDRTVSTTAEGDVTFVQLKDQTAEDVQGYIMNDYLYFRIGKWKVRVVKIIDDDEFKKRGLTVPGGSDLKEVSQPAH